jgi:hypothetical protein
MNNDNGISSKLRENLHFLKATAFCEFVKIVYALYGLLFCYLYIETSLNLPPICFITVVVLFYVS